MKNIILSAVFLLSTTLVSAQGVFDKFENNESVASVVVSKKMFEMMSKVKVDAKDKEAQKYMDLLKKLDNLKVFMTSNSKTANDMKSTVTSYLKSNPLEELMRMNDGGRQVKIYVKSGANENIVKELLMYIEDPSSKDKQAIVMSLTGTFYLDEISALTEKMNLPGGNELKKASKGK
jgi:alpha-acetolactate decarboxylase